MNPRLVALAGPLEGQVFELDRLPFSIGRHSSNDLQLRHISVSRQQCAIERIPDGSFIVRDMESRHGTFVDNVPVHQRPLDHGQQLKIAESLFLFLVDEDQTEEVVVPTALREGDVMANTTMEFPVAQVVYLDPEAMAAALDTQPSARRHLNALLSISTAVHSIRDAEALARRVMELTLQAISGGRAAILLVDSRGDFSEDGYSINLENPQKTVRVSRTIAERVLSERVALLSNDVMLAEDFEAVTSLHVARVCGLLCAPLEVQGRSLGVFYVDTLTGDVRFEEDDLRLLATVATIFASALENTRHLEWLVVENRRLRTADLDHGMVGDSAVMKRIYDLIARLAQADSTVLVRGESGTGKELAAKAIHRASQRADNPFVAINCATLSETLLESELFGHTKGAFTGAATSKEGKLEVANKGTVFLDEVGELPMEIQAKLLRVLQEREFERVGSTKPIKIDIRLVAATNRDLEKAIREGTFREDLFYRLNVISFKMPPLRERREDIPLLASHFASLFGDRFNRRVQGIAPEARDCLLAYDWPGNVRELGNAVERAVVLGQGELIRPEDLPEAVVESRSAQGPAPSNYHEALNETKKRLILDAVRENKGHYTRAANKLGLHPNYLHRLIRNLGLKEQLRDL